MGFGQLESGVRFLTPFKTLFMFFLNYGIRHKNQNYLPSANFTSCTAVFTIQDIFHIRNM